MNRMRIRPSMVTLLLTAFLIFHNSAPAQVAPAPAVNAPPTIRSPTNSAEAQLQKPTVKKLETLASLATSHLQINKRVLPGGASVTLVFDTAPPKENYIYWWGFSEDPDSTVRTAAMIDFKDEKTGEKKLALRLEVPEVGFLPRARELVLASVPEAGGKPDQGHSGIFVSQKVCVSGWGFSVLLALAAVIAAYLIAVMAQGRVGKSYSFFNPVYLTSNPYDKASLSQFQIFGFTLLVFGLLVFVLVRTGMLSDISTDVLLLLGISAAGAAGSKTAEIMKKRLSFENWSWLRDHGWLTVYEAGIGKTPNLNRARWGDLLKTDGSLDIYKFQLAVFSILVGFRLLTTDIEKLATFTIPENLLGLLGLSNVVYIGGKAVAPNSVGQLDEKLSTLRDAERELMGKVASELKSEPSQVTKRAAIEAAPDKYQVYMSTAREAARMLQTLYGTDGTKFKSPTINEDELVPAFWAEVKVPNLMGKTREEAEKALKAVNLKVGKVTEEVLGDTTRAGKVIRQTPSADTAVDGGSAIDLTIAKIAS
jgi:hypothetical protein